MFKTKMLIALFLIFSALAFVLHQKTKNFSESQTQKFMSATLNSGNEMIKHLKSMENFSILAKAQALSEESELRTHLLLKDTTNEEEQINAMINRHDLVFKFLKKYEANLKDQQRSNQNKGESISNWNNDIPLYISAVDAKGLLIADVNYEKGFAKDLVGDEHSQMDKKYPSLSVALNQGKSFFDLWDVKNEILTIAVVPVRSEDMSKILGAVIVGYRFKQNIEAIKRNLFAEISLISNNQIKGNSTHNGADELALSHKLVEIKKYFDDQPTITKTPYETMIGSLSYLILMGELSGYQSAKDNYYLIAVPVTPALNEAHGSLFFVVGSIMVALLLTIIIFGLFFKQFMKPFYEIEHKIFDLAHDKTFDWLYIDEKSEFGDIAQNINQVYSKLTGKELPK
jgi:hypothetical protein